jgi:hypothetical protein
MKPGEQKASTGNSFLEALSKIATAGQASSRSAIEASNATKPSLHTRFVLDPAKPHA